MKIMAHGMVTSFISCSLNSKRPEFAFLKTGEKKYYIDCFSEMTKMFGLG